MRRIFGALARFACAVLIPFVPVAWGHDPLHHMPNPYLANAMNRAGGSCCNGQDYTIADAWERKTDGTYRVMVGSEWHDVPPDSYVENVKNPYTEAILWLQKWHDGSITIRCFKEGVAI